MKKIITALLVLFFTASQVFTQGFFGSQQEYRVIGDVDTSDISVQQTVDNAVLIGAMSIITMTRTNIISLKTGGMSLAGLFLARSILLWNLHNSFK